jgi:tetratricopeptide (TPR) repeat protein
MVRFVALVLITTPAIASLKDIRSDKLPQEESVQKAYAEAAAVEEFADAWSAEWHYKTPKDVVAARLKDSLNKLQKAAASAPDNSELLLLTGLVAHYAYNVDVQEAYDVAVGSLQKAHKFAPDDYRAEWFLGNHECQGGKIKEGMGAFLAVEGRSPWDHLSPAFWDDYIFCASVANMPAHALRAGDHLNKLHAPPSETRTFLMDVARKRFQTPDLNASYSGKEAWETTKEDSRLVFKSSICGFSFSPLGEWKLRRLEVQNGLCVVQIATGPHHSKVGDVVPNLLVIARQAKPEETLDDFVKGFMNFPSPQTVAVSHCPSEQCLAYEALVPGHYGKAGDGHVEMTAFKRDAPEFPGLLFEEPAGPQVPKDGKVTYFHPNERFHRLDGTLYYMVMLDTADSVLGDAKQDYDRLLKYMQAE